MNKHLILKKLSVIVLAAVIVCSGIVIPFELLRMQEESAFDNFILLSSGKDLLITSEAFTYDVFAERIALWDAAQYNESQLQHEQNDGSPGQKSGIIIKKPSGDELTMLEAQMKGLAELQLLVNMRLLPELDLGAYSITGAYLYSIENNADISRWELYFSDHFMVDGEGTDIMICIDSIQGCIYSLSMKSYINYSFELTPTQMEEAFALYHNIEETIVAADGYVQTADGLLQIKATIEGSEYNLEITSKK